MSEGDEDGVDFSRLKRFKKVRGLLLGGRAMLGCRKQPGGQRSNDWAAANGPESEQHAKCIICASTAVPQAFKVLNSARARQAINNLQV